MSQIGRTTTSNTTFRSRIDESDFEALYESLKGMRPARMVIEALTSFRSQEFDDADKLIESARERYEEGFARSVRRLTRDDPTESSSSARRQATESSADRDRRLARKNAKHESIGRQFDALLDGLKRCSSWADAAALAASSSPPAASDSQDSNLAAATGQPSNTDLPAGFREALEKCVDERERRRCIRGSFRLERVADKLALEYGEVYYLRAREQGHLISIQPPDGDSAGLRMTRILDRRPLKRQPVDTLVLWGQRGLLWRLRARDQAPVRGEKDRPDDDRFAATGTAADVVMDMGAFSQLHEAAQRCGLVPNADLIAHVRDREFRLRDYGKASQIIEGLFGKFTAAASQREQRLRREYTDIASGKIKISPRELQQKRSRETAESQSIGRARNRFCRVLEGLRLLVMTQE